jgi:hypothetical protein
VQRDQEYWEEVGDDLLEQSRREVKPKLRIKDGTGLNAEKRKLVDIRAGKKFRNKEKNLTTREDDGNIV